MKDLTEKARVSLLSLLISAAVILGIIHMNSFYCLLKLPLILFIERANFAPRPKRYARARGPDALDQLRQSSMQDSYSSLADCIHCSRSSASSGSSYCSLQSATAES